MTKGKVLVIGSNATRIALTAAGGEVCVGAVDFAPHVVIDRELITGQNPRSDHPIAAALVAALDRSLAPN